MLNYTMTGKIEKKKIGLHSIHIISGKLDASRKNDDSGEATERDFKKEA